jgi:hypothetical protein
MALHLYINQSIKPLAEFLPQALKNPSKKLLLATSLTKRG